MRIDRRTLVAVLLLISLGIPGIAASQTNPRVVKGTVTATNFTSLAANARMIATLYENPAGAPRRAVVALTTPNIGGKAPPFSYELSFTTPVNAGSTYDVEIVLAEGTNIRYKGTARVPNFNTNPTIVNITVDPASGTLPNTSSGAQQLLIALLAAVLAGGLAIWRRMRQPSHARQLA